MTVATGDAAEKARAVWNAIRGPRATGSRRLCACGRARARGRAGALQSAKHGIDVLWSTDSGISARINQDQLLLSLRRT
jgi:hypothetical protein